MVHALGLVAGILLIAIVLVDAFETVIQPRRVTRRIRLTRLFLILSWTFWSGASKRLTGQAEWESSTPRDRRLGVFGPLALLLLLGLWASALVLGFALLQWGLGSAVTEVGNPGFGADFYFSGTTFFTLGLGDIVPNSRAARIVTVAEGATGFSFLALIIGYLPTIYSAFSAREVDIILLDARAGSPPSAVGLMQRFGPEVNPEDVNSFLLEWERWTAQLLESQLSYPVLAFFRSQHERQSWLAALTMIMDAASLVLVGIETHSARLPQRQARLTFAMAVHTIGDLCQVTNAAPIQPDPDRLPPEALTVVRTKLAEAGLTLRSGEAADRQLGELRALYEPYVAAISARLHFPLPPWIPADDEMDDWTTTAWQPDPAVSLRAVNPGVPT